MDLALATLQEIAEELQKRPVSFVLAVAENTNNWGAGDVFYSNNINEGIWIAERAIEYLSFRKTI